MRYDVALHSLAQRVLEHIREQELLSAGDRVGVAVSGGIDSVALLRLLLELRGELGIVLSIVHFNHKLRGAESDGDQEFVAGLAREFGLEFYVDSDDAAAVAREEHISLETSARELRYGFFRDLLGEGREPQGLKPHSSSATDGAAESRAPSNLGSASCSGAESRASSKRDPCSPFAAGNGATSEQDSGARGNPPFGGEATHPAKLDKIVTGHTLDDQAETVLMRVIRGSGLRGLGGIHPRLVVEDDEGEASGEIVRPLLRIRRRELQSYLGEIGQGWREDSTNVDTAFTRNRVRHEVMPLLEKEFNPAVAESLSDLAEIAREEEEYWENEVAGWMGTAVHWSEPEWALSAAGKPVFVQIGAASNSAGTAGNAELLAKIENAPWLVANASVSRVWLLGQPLAVQRRLVKAVGEQAGIALEFKHISEVLRFAQEGSSGKELGLPLGWRVARDADQLLFLTPDLRGEVPAGDYEYELPVPGEIAVPETGTRFEAKLVPATAQSRYNPEHLLDAGALPRALTVRNWRPGDRFWPANTKSPKKVKELLQERRVGHFERAAWPVVLGGTQIFWLRGFPVPAQSGAKPGREALLILETPLQRTREA
jgi:tRNA(Ile)-lysidine synthase